MKTMMLTPCSPILLAMALAACGGEQPELADASSGTAAASSSDAATTDAPTATSDDSPAGSTTSESSSTDAPTTDTPTTDAPTTDATTDATTTGEPVDPGALAACEKALAADLAYATWSCKCLVDIGVFASVDACLAAMEFHADDAACACPLLAADPAHKEALLCYAAAAGDLPGCLEPIACEGDNEALAQCTGGTLGASQTCGPFPRSAAVELQCHGASASACGSGERIPDTWTCDNHPDCRDLSDEAGCSFECTSGELVPIDWKCDGEPDCEDMSDEADCG